MSDWCPDPLDVLAIRSEDKRRRSLAATALRGLADLIENAEIAPKLCGNIEQPRGVCVLTGLSFGFQIGDYLANVVVAEHAFVPKYSEGDGEGLKAGDCVIGDGHLNISLKVDVERVA